MQKVSRHGGNSETSSCAICVRLPLCRYMAGTEETEGVVGDGFWFGVLVGVGSGRWGGGGPESGSQGLVVTGRNLDLIEL